MTPGQRVAASVADMTLNVHGATTAKPKKPNIRHAAVASHTSAPMSFRLRRIESTFGDCAKLPDWGLVDTSVKQRSHRSPQRPAHVVVRSREHHLSGRITHIKRRTVTKKVIT